ncbi:MAG: RagB/SusD family nutrient uptake outer membrane protein [Bacteroidota bacterium]|nr:RagB/SusD family nutrient uptake outer membrane protein [Bacteroidota bacterium]MDP4268924.1 RagB/SusD family nutrient uptake outer membrane protein [Bacteroidota bacterium]
MKKINRIIIISVISMLCFSCSKFLDLQVKNKITSDALYSDAQGIQAYLSSIYYQLPIEDYNFDLSSGFNKFSGCDGLFPPMCTPDALYSKGWHIAYIKNVASYSYWDPAFVLIRDINTLKAAIPSIKPSVMSAAQKQSLIGEVAFLKAYTYFALVKRYGGVPIIEDNQNYSGGDPSVLKLKRATEKDTYDYILNQCDTAAKYLQPTQPRRATKWAAWALQSRVALYAASLAHYPVTGVGQAVDAKLIGALSSYPDLDNQYYNRCIQASLHIIDPTKDIAASGFGLYMPHPASPADAQVNYQKLFEDPNSAAVEVIFAKGWTLPGSTTGHSWDLYQCAAETNAGWPSGARMNPTLDLVDTYETYTSKGASVPINTRLDNSLNYSVFQKGTQASYIHYDNPQDIFAGKDARMFATLITPMSTWKKSTIHIQAGLVKPDGTSLYLTDGSAVKDGVTYYSYGGSTGSSYSGFGNDAQHSKSGFLIRKGIKESNTPLPTVGSVTTDFIDMRYAEVLLNYAEAVIMSGYTTDDAVNKATIAVNIIRQRAGHTYMLPAPVSLENVIRERRVEFAMEGSINMWDLIRRRQLAATYNSFKHKILCPMLDLTTTKPSFFFVRDVSPTETLMTYLGSISEYYLGIPGTAANGLIPNN